MDSRCLQFVLMAEGMELDKVHVHKSYNFPNVTFPRCWEEWGYTNCSGPIGHASPQWYRTRYAHIRDPLAAT